MIVTDFLTVIVLIMTISLNLFSRQCDGGYYVYGLFNDHFEAILTDWGNSTVLNSRVSQGQEEAEEPQTFRRIDRNVDNKLSPRELGDYFTMLVLEKLGVRESFGDKVRDVMEWDANHNGFLEIYEWNRFNRDGPWSELAALAG